jgi:hypothetical protein
MPLSMEKPAENHAGDEQTSEGPKDREGTQRTTTRHFRGSRRSSEFWRLADPTFRIESGGRISDTNLKGNDGEAVQPFVDQEPWKVPTG